MSLREAGLGEIPAETARVARVVCPRGASAIRRSRYRGRPKTHFQHLFTAAATNLARLDARTSGTPRIGTRSSRSETLKPAA